MITQHVRAALDQGLATGDLDAARAYLDELDPVARFLAKRKLEQHVMDAMADASTNPDAAAQSMSHALRVAALRIAHADVAADDPAATKAAYAKLSPAGTATRSPIYTVAAAVLVVGVLTAPAVYVLNRPGLPAKAYVAPRPTPSATATQTGGTPLSDPAMEKLLREELPSFVIAADRARPFADVTTLASQHLALRGSPLLAGQSEAVKTAWQAAVDTYPEWVGAPNDATAVAIAADAARTAWRAFSYAMLDQGLGYYVEFSHFYSGGRDFGLAYAYAVESVDLVQGADQPQRALHLRRLDKLNIGRSELGLESAQHGEPLVLRDNIEEMVRDTLLPALGKNGTYRLGDDVWQNYGTEPARFMKEAAAQIRAEVLPLLGDDAAFAQTTGELLAERTRRLARVTDQLKDKGIRLRLPDALYMPDDYMKEIKRHDVRDANLTSIERDLQAAHAAKMQAKVSDLVAHDVALHEAQHALDARSNRAVPALVEAWEGDAEWGDSENIRATRVANEVSAYLSELANGKMPLHTVWHLADWAFNQREGGDIYVHAALLIFRELGHALMLDVPELVQKGRVDRTALGELLLGITAKPRDQLQAAAQSTWRTHFGADLPALRVATPTP